MQGDGFGLVGAVLEGRYRIDAAVGEGGFGVVYRGQHLTLGHPIAIKCLKTPPHFSPVAREAFIAKFREEGQVLSRLRECPGIVHVYDSGVTPTRQGPPAPFLVLEWLEGQTLEKVLAQRRAQGLAGMALPEALALLAPAFDALAFAHRMKIAHRDIKPANLYLAQTSRGAVLKVLDFGIAKVMQEGDSAQQAATGTGSGFQAFSPGYGAPEQFFSRRYGASGPWTDVHALALVLVEMMSGRPALTGDDVAELLVCATAEQRPTPRSRGLWLPEPVEGVFWRALSLNTGQRPADAEQFYEALRAALHASGQPAPPALPSLASPYGHPSAPVITPPPGQVAAWAPAATSPASYGPAGYPAGHGPGAPPHGAPGGRATPGGYGPPPGPHAGQGAAGYGQPGYPGATGPGHGPATPYSQTALPATVAPTALPPGGAAGPPGQTAGATGPGMATAPASRYLSGTEVGGGPQGSAMTPPPSSPRAGPSVGVRVALAAALAAGALGAGAAALYAVRAAHESATAASAPSGAVGARAVGVPDGVEFALGLAHDRDITGVLPQGQAPAGKWHWRLHRQGGRVVKAEQVRPNGVVAQSERYEYPAGGGRLEHQLDGHGTEQQTTTITADGVVTTTLRSGVTTYRGCNRIQRAFDAAGNVIETRCLALTGVSVVDESGCQALRATYNEQHQETSTGCFSLDGATARPALDREGVHLSRYQFDGSNNQTSVRYFDETGAPVAKQSDGCFGHAYRFDAASNGVADMCLDATGAPRAQTGSTIASTQLDVDAAGCVVGVRYLDVSGLPTASGEVASLALQMSPACDMLGREQRRRDGSRTGKPTGVASWSYAYDDRGDMVSMSCFDEGRRPVSCASGQGPNDAVRRWERDPRGREQRERSFRADGTPSAQSSGYPHETRSSYGDDGQLATRTFLDERGSPATALGKTARMTYRYDALGGLVSEAFFGVDQAPIEASVGCHELRYAHDASHRTASVECLGTDGQPRANRGLINRGVEWPVGAARMAVERGAVVANVYTAPGGRPVKRVECKRAEQSCYR